MYAVIRSGGKQYKVAPGELVKLEKLEAEVGAAIELVEVLLIGEDDRVVVGNPLVKNARVVGEVESQGRGKKIIVFKNRKRKGFHKTQGHRQSYTGVRIKQIMTDAIQSSAKGGESHGA
jgi:large subunit ribosomal protein L21